MSVYQNSIGRSKLSDDSNFQSVELVEKFLFLQTRSSEPDFELPIQYFIVGEAFKSLSLVWLDRKVTDFDVFDRFEGSFCELHLILEDFDVEGICLSEFEFLNSLFIESSHFDGLDFVLVELFFELEDLFVLFFDDFPALIHF